jgi:hypothetical protein
VWVGPSNNSAIHIEFVSVAPGVAETKIGLAGGRALFAFAAEGGSAKGCEVTLAPLRDAFNLSCPVTIVNFAVSQDGEIVTIEAPVFGGGHLLFNEVATLLRQGLVNNTGGLWEPNPGFFLAWISTEPLSGLYVP